MELKVRKLTQRSRVPEYKTAGSAGFDLSSINTVTVPAGSTKVIDTGLAFDIPQGYELQIRPRSGLSSKTTLRISNSPGTIDSDYRGSVGIIIDNISQNQADSYKIKEGDRIAQAILCKVERAEFSLSEELTETERDVGGFGSTGV
jgi:dUTP pyrophosphatase